jgi:hypothetical protein
MATKIKTEPKSEAPVKFYRKIAFGFVALTGILVLLAAYFVLSKAEITISLAKEPLSVDFIADIEEVGDTAGAPSADVPGSVSIDGKLTETTVTAEKEYPTTGSKITEGDVGGKLTIINNYSKDQPLVATTRFLAKEGILYRLKKGVTVPAGGKVEAEVYADKPSEEAEKLGPTTFTIPGLWEGLQDKIYGQSFAPMSGGKREVKFATEADIGKAYEDLTKTLSEQVIGSLKSEMKAAGEVLGKVLIKEINEKRSSLGAGEEGEKFTIKIKLKVVGIAFYRRDIESLAAGQLAAKVPSGKELVGVKYDTMTFLVEKYDLAAHEANIRVRLEGEMSLRSDNPMFDTDKFIGLDREQIIQYLSTYPEIERITIKFSPFWVKKVPQMKNNIKVIIKK